MSKKLRASAVIAAAAAVTIGTALYFKLNNRTVQLNVNELESAVLAKYPDAVITSIEKTIVDENIYLVKVTMDEAEYKMFVTADGEIIKITPDIPE